MGKALRRRYGHFRIGKRVRHALEVYSGGALIAGAAVGAAVAGGAVAGATAAAGGAIAAATLTLLFHADDKASEQS